MAHAIIRGKNGRRYEVEFDDAPVRVEVHASEETVEIFVEADFETHPEERRRFASPPPVQRGHGSDGATRSEGSLMPLPRTLCRFLLQAAAIAAYRGAV